MTVPHRGRFARNLELHLAAKAVALVDFFIAHGSLLIVVMGADAVLDDTVTHFSPAGLRLSTAVLDAVGRAASRAESILGL